MTGKTAPLASTVLARLVVTTQMRQATRKCLVLQLESLWSNSFSNCCMLGRYPHAPCVSSAIGLFGLVRAAHWNSIPWARSASGHYQRKIDKATGVSVSDFKSESYKLQVPQHAKYDKSRTVHEMVVRVPHEELASEFAADDKAFDLPRDATESYNTHPVVVGNPGERVIPLAVYLDGISFTKRDSVLGIFIFNLTSLRRHLVAAIRRSHLCRWMQGLLQPVPCL